MIARQVGMGWAVIVGSALWIGCSDEPATSVSTESTARSNPAAVPDAPRVEPPVEVPVELTPEERVEAGRVAYNANCIACHSLNPAMDGALGPAVAGSSIELLEARVLRAEYPDGYAAKRKTRVMVALPHLEPQLDVLAAYLESLE